MKKVRKPIIIGILLIISIMVIKTYTPKNITSNVFKSTIKDYNEKELKDRIQYIFNQRCNSFITGDLTVFPQYFDTSQKYGKWCLEHEVKRIKYINDWAQKKGIKFTSIKPNVKIKKISQRNNGVKISVDEEYKFDYIYEADEDPITNSFGVMLNHYMVLSKKGEKWVIHNDYYLDCFEDALKAYSGEIKDTKVKSNEIVLDLPNCPKENVINNKGRYNRVKAAEYADRYCGVPWGSGNNLTHNKKYRNYTGQGGDCTNFASQVLGDKEAGNLKFTGGWSYQYSKFGSGSGSTSWVNADSFKNYLLYSGKGRVIKRGNFKDLTTPVNGENCGPVQKLEIGDLIGYAINNNMDHFSIITAFDSHGYPMVNSHTISRYHVPWDLGWVNKNVSFYLIHIND